jgi:4-hydroxybenzoate polyprenyltransferase
MIEISILFKIIRIKQWYKNIVIFLPLVFSLSLLNLDSIYLTIVGFIALSLASSALYIRNDILDIEFDKQHPIKKFRPLASGQISKKNAYIIFVLLLSSSLIIAAILNWQLVIVLIFLFVNTTVYSQWLKNFAYVDLLSISLNFVIRVLAGMLLLQVGISPWLIFGVFLVAFFLGLMKRKSEIIILKDTAALHRKSLSKYSIKKLNYSLLIVSVLVIVTYSLYSITNDPTNDNRLIFTIPIVAIIIFRQYYLSEKSVSVKKFNEVINDKITVLAIIMYIITTILLLYSF